MGSLDQISEYGADIIFGFNEIEEGRLLCSTFKKEACTFMSIERETMTVLGL